MLSRSLISSARRVTSAPMGARFASGLPIPPKIATPKSVQGPPGGDSTRMESVVSFYKSLPKGSASAKKGGGIKARYFDGANASGKPIIAAIATFILIGYSLEHQHLKHHKNFEH
ncbi:hypothetical protein CBS101457_000551 [Exobasidium rhododendri]|nr:hypothetical protein CBS101457_000551 [Exobasidium rhododendri]